MTMPVLTPNAVQQSLQTNGLAALGFTSVALGTRWADVTPASGDFDPAALTLNIAGVVRAPFTGIRENLFRDAASTLANPVGATDTSLVLDTGTGGDFPSPVTPVTTPPSPPGRVRLTLSNSSGSKVEVVECTARSGDTLTVIRGAMGSAKQAFDAGDRVTLRLSLAQRVHEFYDATGSALNVNATVLRLHPQAYVRLRTICAARYAAPGQPAILPIPAAMIVRGAEGFRATRWYRADDELDDVSGAVSFHDARGYSIDPVYVAGLFADLIGAGALPGLVPAGVTATAAGAGGVQAIAGLGAAEVRLHLIDPHGNPPNSASFITDDGSGVQTSVVFTTLLTLPAGNRLVANDANGPTTLRFGFATNSVLTANPLAVPALANGTIPRRYYRVMVVDQPYYLMGNRSTSGANPDDGRIPADLLPVVREQVNITYLADGPDTLAEATRILTRPAQSMIVAVSPNIDQTLVTPNTPGAAAHWPQFPGTNTNAPFPSPPVTPSAANVTAAWTATNDVVVTIAGGAAPDGATVRIFPQQFVEIASINGAEPSFLRGDGGSNIVTGANPVSILLRNPFNLGAAQPRPNPAVLTMDIVVAPRLGRRRLTGAVSVPVGTGPATTPADPFFQPAAGNVMGVMPISMQGVSEAPLFGIPRTVSPPPTPPSNLRDLVLSLAAEPSPRKAPRLPTMARLETIAATGTTAGAPPDGTLLWQAVLTGARWAGESRSALHADGNPGNPAGPDVHAPGISVSGALAYDLAVHALKRAQPIIPLPASNAGTVLGWVATSGGNNFNVPSDAANVANTGVGVMLETVAVGCETPWLENLSPPPAGNTVNSMIASAASAIGVPAPAITVTVANEPRLQREVRREFFAAKHGFRDAQWALRRAFSEARELVYIESPQFAMTARPGAGGPQNYEVDLVAVLADRLEALPALRVVICTPRLADFADDYRTFHRQHYAARLEAYNALRAKARDRVLLFHPVGFPGRTAYIRTTSVIVDDVWCLVGATHLRRRGMTFDGSVAIASYDRQITEGYSTGVRNYRRELMAAKLRVPAPSGGQPLSGEWVRLGRPASAFDVVHDLLEQGGYGRIQSIWPGPSDTSVLPAQPDVADPDGSSGVTMFNTLAGMLNEAGT